MIVANKLLFFGSPVRARLYAYCRRQAGLVIEVVAIGLWALFVTRPYLNMDPNAIPLGGEYLSAIQTHHTWSWAQVCGACALWNGSTRGGAPTFVDPYGSMLHPLVIITSLLWGVRNGAKVALVSIFVLGGLLQWWFARVLNLGRIARLWSGAIAVVAGDLGGRMENGNFGLLLSTVACALVFPPLISLMRTGHRRTAALLGALLAMAIVSGQSYMQVAMLCVLPLTLLLLPTAMQQQSDLVYKPAVEPSGGLLALAASEVSTPAYDSARLALFRKRVVRRLALAVLLAVLLAGVFLVPFIHFMPQIAKVTDPTFGSATPMAFMPLHLVIDDQDFYRTEALKKLPYPYIYVNFIGWIPILFALWGLYHHRRADRRIVLFLALAAVLVLWIASGSLFILGAKLIPDLTERLATVRYHPVMAGLAIPFLLALSAVGVDDLFLKAQRLHLQITHLDYDSLSTILTVDTSWLILLAMAIALAQAYRFNSQWIATAPLNPEVAPVVDALRTPGLQWVNPPFGEHFFIEPAVEAGLKLSQGFRTWDWKDYVEPPTFREADRVGVREGMRQESMVGDTHINTVIDSGLAYAVVLTADMRRYVCVAHGLAGDIDVQCNTPSAGVLTIEEHSWNGWFACVDGQIVPLQPGQWLSVQIPAGPHTIMFRYRPWDVILGLLCTASGVVLAIVMCGMRETESL